MNKAKKNFWNIPSLTGFRIWKASHRLPTPCLTQVLFNFELINFNALKFERDYFINHRELTFLNVHNFAQSTQAFGYNFEKRRQSQGNFNVGKSNSSGDM